MQHPLFALDLQNRICIGCLWFIAFIVVIAALTATGGKINSCLCHCHEYPRLAPRAHRPLVHGEFVVFARDGVTVCSRDTGRPVWTRPWSCSGADVSIESRRVFVATTDSLYALDLTTGLELWQATMPPTLTQTRFEGTMVSAVGPVVVACRNWTVLAFDARCGRSLWTWSAGSVHDGMNWKGIALHVVDETVVVPTYDSMVCLNLADGTERWTRPGLAPICSSSVGEPVLLSKTSHPDLVVRVEPRTGKTVWWAEVLSSEGWHHNGHCVCSAPGDGHVYVSSSTDSRSPTGRLDCLDVNDGRSIWSYGPFFGECFCCHNIDVPFNVFEDEWYDLSCATPVVDGGYVYFYAGDGVIHRVDARMGQGGPLIVLRRQQVSPTPSSWFGNLPFLHWPGFAPYADCGYPVTDLAAADGRLYVACRRETQRSYAFAVEDWPPRRVW